MKKSLIVLILVVVAVTSFIIGAYFGPYRYKIVSGGFQNRALFKLDTVTGKTWRYDYDENSFIKCPQKETAFSFSK